MEHFLKLFDSINDKRRSDFLLNLLKENDELKQRFIEHFKDAYEQIRRQAVIQYEPELILQSIQEKAATIRESFEEIDLEEVDLENWSSRGYYVPEYEIAAEMAEDEVDDALQAWLDVLTRALKLSDFVEVIRKLAAIILASETAVVNDPYDHLSDSVNQYFANKTKEFLDNFSHTITNRFFSDEDLKNGFDLLFRFNHTFLPASDRVVWITENMLISLISNKNTAEYVDEAIVKHQVDLQHSPLLSSHIATKLGDQQRWIATLENSFGIDYPTSEELTAYFYENDLQKFDEYGSKLFAHFGSKSIDFLIDKVQKGSSLHLDILKNRMVHKADFEAYTELKLYIEPAEATALIDQLPSSDSKAMFYGKEKDFDKLEALIRKNTMQFQWYGMLNFREALRFLYPGKPDAAWEFVKKIIEKKMQSDKNRQTYQLLAELLADAMLLANKQAEIQNEIMKLYGHRPNLPALKDEFRKAGLIK